MQITKLGHCCLVIEEEGVKLMTDPGSFTVEEQEKVTGLDAIVITHEHQDHFHTDSIQKILAQNPHAVVVANSSVGKLLGALMIDSVLVGDGGSTEVKGVSIEGFGSEHAPIYETMGLVENTGYRIADKLYFPGDNFFAPQGAVDVLALPVAGPWVKMSDAIDFAKKIEARTAFGVHDGMIQPSFRGFIANAFKMFVPDTSYVQLHDGESKEL